MTLQHLIIADNHPGARGSGDMGHQELVLTRAGNKRQGLASILTTVQHSFRNICQNKVSHMGKETVSAIYYYTLEMTIGHVRSYNEQNCTVIGTKYPPLQLVV
jgi:hypothetical protein